MTNLKSILSSIITIIAIVIGIVLLPIVIIIIAGPVLFKFYKVIFTPPPRKDVKEEENEDGTKRYVLRYY